MVTIAVVSQCLFYIYGTVLSKSRSDRTVAVGYAVTRIHVRSVGGLAGKGIATDRR